MKRARQQGYFDGTDIGMLGDTGPVVVPLRYWWQAYPSGQPRFIYPMFAAALLWPAVPLRMRFAANDA